MGLKPLLALLGAIVAAAPLAGSNFQGPLFMCDPKGNATIAAMITKGLGRWLPPAID